jgi:AraC-like DNA-binding protein
VKLHDPSFTSSAAFFNRLFLISSIGEIPISVFIFLNKADLTVDSLVEEAGISRSALFKKIKTLIGISPMELIKNKRLKKAAELVKEGSCNFTQIAYKTGFNDSQYFSKCFKQIYGVTPTEYKRKNLS